jgi:hypothetical protein
VSTLPAIPPPPLLIEGGRRISPCCRSRGVCAVVSAVIASARGRSGVGFFFLGLLTGIIGPIVAVCLPNKKQQEIDERRHRELLASLSKDKKYEPKMALADTQLIKSQL